jgi:hypothetical protein
MTTTMKHGAGADPAGMIQHGSTAKRAGGDA